MQKYKFKELCIAHKFLTECDLPVPKELLIALSGLIRDEQERRRAKRIEKMSEEELALLDEKTKHSVRVTTEEGILIKAKKNHDTFLLALERIGLEMLAEYDFKIGRHPIIYFDKTLKKTRMAKYKFVKPGFFVYKTGSSANIIKVLREIDSTLQLNMDVELV